MKNNIGKIIKKFREDKNMSQAELSKKLFVSDKTISKWETNKSYPDVKILENIAKIFDISMVELLSGEKISNFNEVGNINNSNLYICPICGNIVASMGEVTISCHGLQLLPLKAEKIDCEHEINIIKSENEYYVSLDHPMEKDHYCAFILALSLDGIQFKKLYPQGACSARFRIDSVKKIFVYCNKDGLFYKKINSDM